MKTTDEYICLLREFKFTHAAKYGIKHIGIFGSVARGEQTTNSDIDICIDSLPMGMFALAGLSIALEELFGAPVDIVRIRENMNPRFKKRIEKEVIYV